MNVLLISLDFTLFITH
uniref:Uncharacterized protein n=1 Tax=Arundo donax TaxID=35708 RepID=A0A0A8YLF5_ARUDO